MKRTSIKGHSIKDKFVIKHTELNKFVTETVTESDGYLSLIRYDAVFNSIKDAKKYISLTNNDVEILKYLSIEKSDDKYFKYGAVLIEFV